MTLREIVNNISEEDYSEQASIGPIKYAKVAGREVTVIDGPFVTRVMSSGPLRGLVVSEDKEEQTKNQTTSSSNTVRI